jgi:hypothetical protein
VKRSQAEAFDAKLKAVATPREKRLDRLEEQFERKLRELQGTVAGARAEAIVSSHRKKARPGGKNGAGAALGVGFGNVWADAQASDRLRKRKLKATEENLKIAREEITKPLLEAGLREMSCLTMMREPLQEYARVSGILNNDEGAAERLLGIAIDNAKDARSEGPTFVPEARGTVLLEELRGKFGFKTIHVDALTSDAKLYWNNQKHWNYSSDRDARQKARLPKDENYRKVKGAESHQDIDVSVGIDYFVKLDKKMTPESRKWWDVLQHTEFAVGVADQGYHTYAVSRGFVYEVHWDKGPDDPTLTERTGLREFFKPHGDWGSGIIALPPGALPQSSE